MSVLKVNPYMPIALCPVQFLIRVPKWQIFINFHVSCIKLICELLSSWKINFIALIIICAESFYMLNYY